MALTSPYNFVPLNSKVYIPDWYNLVSQDIPFEDGEDGYIELTWHNDSPLFIRNEGKDNSDPMYVDDNGKRRYFIPGSSIKGMLRNVLSILALGKMEAGEQYQDRFFGHREIGSGQTDSSEYHQKMDNAKCGWLELDKDSKDGKEHYLLYPCDGDLSRIFIDESRDKKHTSQHYVRDYCKGYDNGRDSSWERNEAIRNRFNKWFPELQDFPRYRLFATGTMRTKKNELLIPAKTKDPIVLEDNVVSKFFDVYEPSPNFEKYKDLLEREHERIPVLYAEENGSISAIGMGRMFRYPYNQGIRDIVKKEQDPTKYAGQRDLCETIFGWIGNDNSAKGRVQFSNAWAEKEIPDDRPLAKGVLGQPKASFYPLYIKQKKDAKTYNSYSSKGIEISGRKRYRIHKGSSTMDLPKGNGNENTITSFKAIPAGNDFKMRINVHNLRPVEIGALLSAITFHNTCSAFHNIGAAKSFGYGKLHCDSGQIRLFGLKKSFIEYLKDFECQMNVFYSNIDKTKAWRDTIQVMRLLGIMSEHGEGLEMMKLEDYTESKNTKGKGQIVVLEEKERSPEKIVDNNDLKLRLFSVTIQSITDKLQYIIVQKQTKDTDKLAQLKCLCSNVKDVIASMRSLGAEVAEYADVIAEIAEQVRLYEIKCKTPLWNKQIEDIKASMVLSNEANGVLSIKSKAQEIFNEITKYKADTSVISVLIKDIDNRINQLKILAFRAKYSKEYAEAQAVYDRIDSIEGKTMPALKTMDMDVTTAINLYEKIISMLRRDGLEDSIVTDRIKGLKDKKAKIEKMLVESDSLRTRLEAKQGEKNAVRDWKVCSKKIEQWNKTHELSADDKDAIEETVRRLFEEPTREEKERWTKRDSHIWKALEGYLGKERADNLFNKPNDTKKQA